MDLVGGLEEIHSENKLTIMLPKSVSRWAASVMMARLCAKEPPARNHSQSSIRVHLEEQEPTA